MDLFVYSHNIILNFMDSSKINLSEKSIKKLIAQHRFKEAFAAIRQIADEIPSNWNIFSETDDLEQSYRYMIKYAAEGIDDPHRKDIYENITTKLYDICESAINELTINVSQKYYYRTIRYVRGLNTDLETSISSLITATGRESTYSELPDNDKNIEILTKIRTDIENIESSIFKKIWTIFPVKQSDADSIKGILTSEKIPRQMQELAIAAIMMNLLEHYNENMLAMLIDTYTCSTDTVLQLKSLSSALIIMHKYRDSIRNSQKLSIKIENLYDNKQACSDIMTIFLQFIRSRGTERITRKVQNELVPELMKLRPELRRKLQGSELPEDAEALADNPDWQEILDKSGITDKMLELNRMQSEGNDVFMSSFSKLKTFPFFKEIANWFMPFDMKHSAALKIFKSEKSPLIEMINRSGVFCDNDKFSFILSLTEMPESQRKAMSLRLDEQNTQIMEMNGESLLPNKKQRENIVANHIQNLYRFFYLFEYRAEFYNPFTNSLNMTEVPFISKMLSDTENLKIIAEFYFKQEFYTDAIILFSRIAEEGDVAADIYQKLGFCFEHNKDYAKAIESYEKAELTKSDDIWTLKHIAACHRACGKPESAISYYKRAEELRPQNTALANTIGNCFIEAGEIKEALRYYFKAYYIAGSSQRTMRPIAWCSFLDGNYTQSIEYYDKIMALGATCDDCINRSHAILASGNIKEAIKGYVNATKMQDGSTRQVTETIDNDRKYLIAEGIDDIMISIIIDKIRYDT